MTERIHKAKGLESEFLILRNKDVQRDDLSYEAIGMLAYLMSLPSDWKIYVSTLKRKGTGRDAVKRILSELQSNGYLYVNTDVHDEKGQFAPNEYHAYAMPEYNHNWKPVTENPSTVNPSTENQPLQSKEEKKEKKEKELSIEASLMLGLIKKELKQYGAVAKKMALLAVGQCTGKDKELNLDTPMTEPDFMAMMAWWDKKKDSNGNKLARPSNLGSFRRNALLWQEESKPKQAVQVTPPKPTNGMNAARAMAMLNQATYEDSKNGND